MQSIDILAMVFVVLAFLTRTSLTCYWYRPFHPLTVAVYRPGNPQESLWKA